MSTEIVLPEMGEGVIEGTIATWLKQVGDQIEEFEPIVEVETDKVTTEITAEVEGVLLEILVEEGETVPVGTVLAVVEAAGEEVAAGPETNGRAARVAEGRTEKTPAAAEVLTDGNGSGKPYSRQTDVGWVSPVVARIATEHDVDLTRVEGTGRNGRITKKDVLAYLEEREVAPVAEPATVEPQPSPERVEQPKARPAAEPPQVEKPSPVSMPAPSVSAAEGEVVPLTNIRRRIAEHMVYSKQTSPHVTTIFEFDFSAVAAHRAAHKAQFARDDIKLTYMAYIAQATVEALRAHPMANSSWTDDGILLRRAINLGIATAIEAGLVVPVIKNADDLNLRGLARAIGDLAERARNNKLDAAALQGGTFTITNHGASGSLAGTPIINQPQCGILGVGLIEKRVKVVDDAIAIRPCAYVSFTFDHRILDGATADAFVMAIKETIENWP